MDLRFPLKSRAGWRTCTKRGKTATRAAATAAAGSAAAERVVETGVVTAAEMVVATAAAVRAVVTAAAATAAVETAAAETEVEVTAAVMVAAATAVEMAAATAAGEMAEAGKVVVVWAAVACVQRENRIKRISSVRIECKRAEIKSAKKERAVQAFEKAIKRTMGSVVTARADLETVEVELLE